MMLNYTPHIDAKKSSWDPGTILKRHGRWWSKINENPYFINIGVTLVSSVQYIGLPSPPRLGFDQPTLKEENENELAPFSLPGCFSLIPTYTLTERRYFVEVIPRPLDLSGLSKKIFLDGASSSSTLNLSAPRPGFRTLAERKRYDDTPLELSLHRRSSSSDREEFSSSTTSSTTSPSPPVSSSSRGVTTHAAYEHQGFQDVPMDLQISSALPPIPPPPQDEPMDFSISKRKKEEDDEGDSSLSIIYGSSVGSNCSSGLSLNNNSLLFYDIARLHPIKSQIILKHRGNCNDNSSHSSGVYSFHSNEDSKNLNNNVPHHNNNKNDCSSLSGCSSGSPLRSDVDSFDFDELSNNQTEKWLLNHPDFCIIKMLDGLKTELPPFIDLSTELSKPPDINSLDNATAHLLQMSDPSTTFPDISTDCNSIYDNDDPFNLGSLLPSNFSIAHLDSAPPMISPMSNCSSNNSESLFNRKTLGAYICFAASSLSRNNKPSVPYIKNEEDHYLGSSPESTSSITNCVPLEFHKGIPFSPQPLASGTTQLLPQSQKKGGISLENELSNIPIPMRLNILRERLGLPPDATLEVINGGFGIKNPLAIDSVDTSSGGKSKDNSIIRPESDPSKFQCRICYKVFPLQRLLNRHMKCHSDTKRYLCTFCGKGFNDTFDLKRHTRTHTGVRPYKCNLCEKSFTQRCSLESHCMKVHGVAHEYEYKQRRSKMYVCEDCGNTTKEPEAHYLHLKENHPFSPALLKFYDKRHFQIYKFFICNHAFICKLKHKVHYDYVLKISH
ncbi:OVOL [Lepeophtheirus salmonis]|uniref:OVOL n=1 Tax=Lepeophtheirus salmonis TaxID=72036 RepID=A0A7R8D1B5_LEPSM|nr:OVOL [Lepeophtheirus salmonis]CAF2948814.1 OVOL [Lepeophtheirus salmonis]